jgi:hypothetical protein
LEARVGIEPDLHKAERDQSEEHQAAQRFTLPVAVSKFFPTGYCFVMYGFERWLLQNLNYTQYLSPEPDWWSMSENAWLQQFRAA